MSKIDKQALNQEKIEWLNKLADMEYCKSNPGHWLMSLKDTNMLAKLALRSVALLDELEAAQNRSVELPSFDGYVPHIAKELQAAFKIACAADGITVKGDSE
ncbi:ead/Ea22-like family protein [Enterobacter asburiae]|uniref:ead/Ea22-like family protein n=1 Tax=Enterobacter asburiae TaxID=61645 RepID=UPI00207434A9|nr:ead/Ea22-like family protein [Enterobacter asburiae]